jgi:DNA-binding CsgD family transcriptional regulator
LIPQEAKRWCPCPGACSRGSATSRRGRPPRGSLEVLVLAARGHSNRRIGQELYLAEATVKRHLANVYEKVGVRSRNAAVRTALVEQWIGFHEITSNDDGNGSSDEQAR